MYYGYEEDTVEYLEKEKRRRPNEYELEWKGKLQCCGNCKYYIQEPYEVAFCKNHRRDYPLAHYCCISWEWDKKNFNYREGYIK